MPIFEFRCAECGYIFEEIFRSADEEIELTCPECRCEHIERVVSRTSHVMGAGPGGKTPTISSKSCGSGNECYTLDLPGPSK